MLRIQRGLRNPWLLSSQDEVTLTPPRALFTLDLMPHGRVRHSLLFAALPSGCPTGHSQTMLVLMVTGILDGDYTNSSNLTLLATRRQPHSLFERWSNLFGGWTPHHRASHPDAHPKRIEHGASRLEAKAIRDRWHSCPHCGLELDRDHNAAINIKQRAVGHPVLKARGVRRNSGTAKREARSLCEA
jgi:Putative transposase DNA-binding domain